MIPDFLQTLDVCYERYGGVDHSICAVVGRNRKKTAKPTTTKKESPTLSRSLILCHSFSLSLTQKEKPFLCQNDKL